jgi:hypothetical protein
MACVRASHPGWSWLGLVGVGWCRACRDRAHVVMGGIEHVLFAGCVEAQLRVSCHQPCWDHDSPCSMPGWCLEHGGGNMVGASKVWLVRLVAAGLQAWVQACIVCWYSQPGDACSGCCCRGLCQTWFFFKGLYLLVAAVLCVVNPLH